MGNKIKIPIILIFLVFFSTLLFSGVNTDGSRLISWDPVTLDINGNPESNIYYYIYCNETQLQEPTSSYFIAATAGTSFRHYDDRYINPEFRLYYLVTAVDEFGNESSGALDFSLPVELYSFDIAEENGKIILNWTTQSEKDNLGFNVFKSSKKNSHYELLNRKLIQRAGNAITKTDYTYIDSTVQPLQSYYYKLESVQINGAKTQYEPKNIYVTGGKPDRFILTQNYPNPFNPQTTIKYAIPKDCFVEIIIYNTRGEKIRQLVNTYQSTGLYTVSWDGYNNSGRKVSSGIYYYKLETEKFNDVKKMILTK